MSLENYVKGGSLELANKVATLQRLRLLPYTVDPEDSLEGTIHYLNLTDMKIRLKRLTDFIDIPTIQETNEPNYMTNKLKGILPTQSGWGTAPNSLANVTDEKESTVTGTGSTTLGAAGTLGYVSFDLGQKMRVFLTAKVGLWATANTPQVRWRYSDDGSTWVNLTEFDAAQNYGTTESIRYLRMEYCDARYIQMRFYLSGAGTGSAKIYEAWAFKAGADEIPINPTDPTGWKDGWGGYEGNDQTQAQINAIIDDLQTDVCTAMRYWAFQNWYRVLYGYSALKEYNQQIADWIVARAVTDGVVVYLDVAHGYPPDPYNYIENPKGLGTSYETQWKAEMLAVGQHFASATNVVLEIVNESWHLTVTEEKAMLNRCISNLRTNGVHLPLLCNLSWTLSDTLLTDADGNYAIGRHMYCPSWLGNMNKSGTPPWNLDTVADEIPDPSGHPNQSVNSILDKIFHSTSETYYVQKALSLGIPNGMVFTEMGASPSGTYLDTPRPYGMCYVMRFARECKQHGTPLMRYRIGNMGTENRKPTYKQKAIDYFNTSIYPP